MRSCNTYPRFNYLIIMFRFSVYCHMCDFGCGLFGSHAIYRGPVSHFFVICAGQRRVLVPKRVYSTPVYSPSPKTNWSEVRVCDRADSPTVSSSGRSVLPLGATSAGCSSSSSAGALPALAKGNLLVLIPVVISGLVVRVFYLFFPV
jgi:hypothetical protein